jgi:glucuronoarabinoxylan endo-1,4-beta-xylanase
MKSILYPAKIIRALAVLAAAGALSINAHADCNINMGSTSQTIDGYGFSTAWCGQEATAIQNLMGTGSGQCGFTLLRIRIDPNKGWTDEAANSATAHSMGGKVLGTPWSPPASMKSNGNVVGGSLLASQYGNYASFLNQAASSINLDYVSVQNEPDWNPTYEGCVWTGAQLDTFCANNAPAIGRSVVMPEALGFNDSYSDPTLNDSTAASHVTIIAGHFYGSGNYVHQNALNHGKHVWMTEISRDNVDIGTCLTTANEISDAMNNQFSAYFWWWNNESQACALTSGGSPRKNAYTIGQFSKFVRPGSVRVSADHNPASGVSVTSYKVNGNLVIVAVNANTGGTSVKFNISNGSVGSVNGYRTSSGENMSGIGTITVSSGSFTTTLAAQSITTFVQASSGGGGAPVSGSTYKLIARHSGKAMDAYGNQTANGTQIIQWTYGGGANQKWTVTDRGSSQWSIIGVQSGRCIDISASGTANGTKVQLWDYLGGSNQKYILTATDSGYYRLSPTHCTGSCLDVSGVSTADGANIQLWQWLSGSNQQWAFQAP